MDNNVRKVDEETKQIANTLLKEYPMYLTLGSYEELKKMKEEYENNLSFKTLQRLLKCFPGSLIDENMNFIISKSADICIDLNKCKNKDDLTYELIYLLSQYVYKIEPYYIKSQNIGLHKMIKDSINKFLSTNLSVDDFMLLDENKDIDNGAIIKNFISNKCNIYC